jgi:ATP synthase protein I
MHTPIDAGRHLNQRATVWQLIGGLILALVFLYWGGMAALAAGYGAWVMAAGSYVAGRRTYVQAAPDSNAALMHLIGGLVLKWLLMLGLLAIGFLLWKLPGVPLIVGILFGEAVFLFAHIKQKG